MMQTEVYEVRNTATGRTISSHDRHDYAALTAERWAATGHPVQVVTVELVDGVWTAQED